MKHQIKTKKQTQPFLIHNEIPEGLIYSYKTSVANTLEIYILEQTFVTFWNMERLSAKSLNFSCLFP